MPHVYGYSGKDFSIVRMNCIKGDFDTVWPLYAETITVPAFDTKEFTRIKQDAINNLKESDARPDAAIDKYADKVAFAGRDYAKDPRWHCRQSSQKLPPRKQKLIISRY